MTTYVIDERSGATENLKRLQLELGEKSPALVHADADLDAAIDGVANGIFWNNGKCCDAGTRLYAHDNIYAKAVVGIASTAESIAIGDSMDEATQMDPLISSHQLVFVQL